MTRDGSSTRRAVLTAAVATGTAALAGCGDPEGTGEGTPDVPEEGRVEDGEEPEVDEEAWSDVEAVHLEAYREGWEVVEPGDATDMPNPPIGLHVGRTYEFSFENADGERHSLELWTDTREAVEATDYVEEEGGTASMSVEATEEMEWYVCGEHDSVMVGPIVHLGQAGSN